MCTHLILAITAANNKCVYTYIASCSSSLRIWRATTVTPCSLSVYKKTGRRSTTSPWVSESIEKGCNKKRSNKLSWVFRSKLEKRLHHHNLSHFAITTQLKEKMRPSFWCLVLPIPCFRHASPVQIAHRSHGSGDPSTSQLKSGWTGILPLDLWTPGLWN